MTTLDDRAHEPITPGEILRDEFLEPLGVTPYRLAQATGLSQARIGEIVRGRRRVTPDTALRLSEALGLSDGFWLNIQMDFDIELAHDQHDAELGDVEVLVVA